MTTRWIRAPGVLWRRTIDGVLLRPVGPGDIRPVLLSGSGSLLWNALGTPTSVESLSEHLAAETGSDASLISADVRRVLDQLVHAGVIEVVP